MTDFPVNSPQPEAGPLVSSALSSTAQQNRHSDEGARSIPEGCREVHGRERAGVAPKGSLVTFTGFPVICITN